MIERNVTFNESALLQKNKEITSKIDTSIQDNVSKKVDFEDMGTQQPSQIQEETSIPDSQETSISPPSYSMSRDCGR